MSDREPPEGPGRPDQVGLPGHRGEPPQDEPRAVSHLSDVRRDSGSQPEEFDSGPEAEPRMDPQSDLEPDPQPDPQPEPTDDPDEQPRLGRLENAQSAAGDLSRMGIDPRSLGLDAPDPVTRARRTDPSSRQPSGRTPGRPPGQLPVGEPGQGSGPGISPGINPGINPGADPGANVVRLRAQEPVRTTPEPAVAEPERTASPFETALSRTGPPPAARADPRRMFRTVARGLATPDAAASVQQERALVEAVRRRQTERRLVAFVSGKGGVGCSTVAVGVGTTLMAMREDRSVVVDVQQGTSSLGEWAGVDEPRTITELVARREDYAPAQTASGLGVVDGAGWDQTIGRADVSGVLERLGRDHTFHLLDIGDDAGEGGHTALARADLVVLVGSPGPGGATAAAAALDRVRYVNPEAAARVVSVLVCTHEATFREAQRELAPGPGGSAGLVVPPEALLAGGGRFDPAGLGPATREAYLRIAAAVVTGRGTR